jgi:hypothetical protein
MFGRINKNMFFNTLQTLNKKFIILFAPYRFFFFIIAKYYRNQTQII